MAIDAVASIFDKICLVEANFAINSCSRRISILNSLIILVTFGQGNRNPVMYAVLI